MQTGTVPLSQAGSAVQSPAQCCDTTKGLRGLERNIDKVKRLERELGRYRKKVADQQEEHDKLKRDLQLLMDGNREMQQAVDAILAETAVKYGTVQRDADGTVMGWNISIPCMIVDETLKRYEIRARRDEPTDSYQIGVIPKGGCEPDAEQV
jgi:hypothetical protein